MKQLREGVVVCVWSVIETGARGNAVARVCMQRYAAVDMHLGARP